MDKQDEGLKLLKEIRTINHLIEDLQMQIDEVYTMLTSATVKPKDVNVQTSKAPDPMADKVIEILEYQTRLQEHQSQLVEKKNIALKIVSQMDVDMQQVLLLRYFKGYSVEETGERIGYTYRWAWEKIHQAEEVFIQMYAMNDITT